MYCEEIQFNLPLYADDILSAEERVLIEDHLPGCPVCRTELAEYRSLRNELRQISVSEVPAGLNQSIKSAIHDRLDQRPAITIAGARNSSVRDKVMHWLMPYSIGTVAASIFTIGFLFVLMSDLQSSVNVLEVRSEGDKPVLLANANVDEMRPDLQLPGTYNGVRIAVTPPEFNPAGALLALTKSIVRGDMKDEEVVVVADVFGNGLARIAEVVDPPENDEAMRELQRAFETEPGEAPFLPSKLDQNEERVRIVLKIQRVDVDKND
jgi:hypothetical protein